ncbi:hypothetical protein SFRURICE_020803, partial [Spodoptera frugiperda]
SLNGKAGNKVVISPTCCNSQPPCGIHGNGVTDHPPFTLPPPHLKPLVKSRARLRHRGRADFVKFSRPGLKGIESIQRSLGEWSGWVP